MYVIKETPEDFLVAEIPSVTFKPEGEFMYFWLKKRDLTTIDAVQKVADFIGIPLHHIGFAGNKDKRAITTQLCSVQSSLEHRLSEFTHPKIQLTIAGYGDEHIATGMLTGNKFTITVRNTPQAPTHTEWFVNYYGSQRFSSHNIAIGRAILRGEYKEAVTLIQEREGWQSQLTKTYLASHPTDYVGALKRIPKKIMKLVLHAYQSHLWNKAAAFLVKNQPPSPTATISLPGFGFEGELSDFYQQELHADGLTFDSFIIRALPSFSMEATHRHLWTYVPDLEIRNSDTTTQLTFTLPKGSYATELVSQLFKNVPN